MSKHWTNVLRIEGETSRQAHADFPEGTYEREMGAEGFFGPVTHFFHKNPPTDWVSFEGPLKPRAFDSNNFIHDGSCPWKAISMLHNNHADISFWSTDNKMDHLVRDADGDLLLFVHKGSGHLYCDFGHLTYRDGDYIMLPRGTMWRLEPDPDGQNEIMLISAKNSHFQSPDRGILGPTALYDPAILDVPSVDEEFRDQQSIEGEWQVLVRRNGEITVITYPFNPLDAVGWKGNLTPIRLNWRDIRPVISHSYHIPPSAHTTFVADRFVVCTFVPRPMESDPGALKLPFYHNNDDYDEFLFYHRGQFMSRDNIHPGMTTFHPAGFTHGPHPKAFANAEKNAGKMTNEVAVMVDTRDPLLVSEQAEGVEWKEYVDSWKTKE